MLIHIGVGLEWLAERIRVRGNNGVISRDGKPLSDAKALAYVQGEIAKGKRISSGCPTPQPDGSCPGHEKAARPEGSAR